MTYLGLGAGSDNVMDTKEWIASDNQKEFYITYINKHIDVYVNGVLLSKDDYISDDGTKVILKNGLQKGDVVRINTYEIFRYNDVFYKSQDNSTVGDIIFSKDEKGIILKDRNNEKNYRFYINNGVIGIEEV